MTFKWPKFAKSIEWLQLFVFRKTSAAGQGRSSCLALPPSPFILEDKVGGTTGAVFCWGSGHAAKTCRPRPAAGRGDVSRHEMSTAGDRGRLGNRRASESQRRHTQVDRASEAASHACIPFSIIWPLWRHSEDAITPQLETSRRDQTIRHCKIPLITRRVSVPLSTTQGSSRASPRTFPWHLETNVAADRY